MAIHVIPDLKSLPEPVDGVLIVTKPANTEAVVRQCVELGVRRVWMHCSLGTRPRLGAKLAAAVGSAALACGGGQSVVKLTATPGPTSTPRAAPTLPAGTAADAILINGRVVTMDAGNTVTQAAAITGDRILQTGADDAIRALSGPQTQMIDLLGRTVTPGFVDAHNHLSAMGLIGTAYIDINPPGVRTVEELQAKIAEGCARKGPGKWLVAQGFISFDGQYPDKYMLDPVSPDNPVMLINQGGHMGAVNSYALNLAGVTASTPDPRFGILVRDQNGEPTGALINHSAMDLSRRLWGEDFATPEIMYQSTIAPQDDFASFGVTSFGDVNARGMRRMEAYFHAARNSDMTIRAYILNSIEYFQEVEGRTDAIEAMRFENDFMRFGGFKFLLDGAGVASYMHEPTKGTSWNMATWDPEQLNEAVRTFHDLGYQCACHVIGDAAVDMALDAYENAIGRNPRPDPRHRLEHAVLNTEDALLRQRDLGVVISMQPHAIRLLADALTDLWGEERTMRIVPTRSWLDLGVPLSISSDAPTLPWWQPPLILAAAVTRLSLTNKVIGPDQILTIDEAMRAYTLGGAYAEFAENVKGSLEPGKFADLVVWRLDPYIATLNDMMAEHPVDMTMVGGRIVFEV